MENRLAGIAAPAEITPSNSRGFALDLPPIPAPPVVTEGQADLRLIIEEDPKGGSYVYKTVDRRTGDIVAQFPREDVLKLKDADTYSAGTVFSANI